MRNKITMEMSICQAENGFSSDELVKKVADSYENKAFAAGSRAGSTRWRVRASRGILLKAPEAREPRTGRQPTTTEADVRPLRADFF